MSDDTRLDPTMDDDVLLDALRRLGPPGDLPPAPPDRVLSGILAAVAEDETEPVTDHGDGDDAAIAPVVPIGAARRRRLPMFLSAAAAVVVIAVGAVVVLRGGDDAPVASASLDALVTDVDEGSAELRRTDDGYVVEVVADVEAGEGEFLELWLIDEAVTEPLSLGAFTGSGTYVVPDDVDPGTHPVVDISVEPIDGGPEHSGDSLLRGALDV